jgi:DNA polymerase-3 subunit epsilon
MSSVFAALDFETADHGADSACAAALVRVEDGRIVARAVELIRPPRQDIRFTYIHRIDWSMVADKEPFARTWPRLAPLLDGIDFIAAHNAPFDRGVLRACCAAAGMPEPPHRFVDTVHLARRVWKIFPTKLPDVCAHLNIPLNHHDALSDAEACARIVIEAHRVGAAIADDIRSRRPRA